MLLFDLSAIVIGAVIEVTTKGEELTLPLVRKVTASRLLYYKKRFSKQFGPPIICADSRHYWRKDFFKYYKQNRKKARKKAKFDWELFFEYFGIVKDEIRDNYPYIFLEVEKVEADDIIAVLTMHSKTPVMIVSSDKDMKQLMVRGYDVKIFSPAVKKFLTASDYSLIEHYIRGDSSDGIPNILSDDDVFMCEDKRQNKVTKSFVESCERARSINLICDGDEEMKRKLKRNMILIDVKCIPDKYKRDILIAYRNAKTNPPKNNLYAYFKKHKMQKAFERVGDY